MATQEQITLDLAEIVADLRCQREASDAVAVATAAVLLSLMPVGVDLITPMRKMLHTTIMPPRSDDAPIDTVELLRLRTEQYVQDHLDRIEKLTNELVQLEGGIN